jgi:hypothetical protein
MKVIKGIDKDFIISTVIEKSVSSLISRIYQSIGYDIPSELRP